MSDETRSLWIATTPSRRFTRLHHGLDAEVAIIGGGITGLTAALLLKERGKKVVLLDKSAIAEGESGLTTAHITEAVDVRYHHLAKHFSGEVAAAVAAASRAAIEMIAANIDRYSIRCHFRRLAGYLYTEKRNKVAELKSEAASAKEAGVSATFVSEVPLPFATRGAVRFDDQAQFHPREYFVALASQLGDVIYDDTLVLNVDEGDPCRIETTAGTLTAGAVFIATNAPLNDVTLHTRTAAYRSYAIAFPSNSPVDGMFWDTADPYHYTRWQETDEGTFLIIGGEDHKVGHEEDTHAAFDRVEQYAREYFQAGEARYRWSGQIIEPHDGLPFIGKTSEKIYVSTGYAGQGMTFGTFGGMLVADLITGRENRYAEIFDPSRKHLRGAMRDLIRENLDYPKEMATRAVTRDDAPICTHMGCRMRWNTAERTWDCPCHGSRFADDGRVVNGPATRPLAMRDGG